MKKIIFILLLISLAIAADTCPISEPNNPTGCDSIKTPWAKEACELFTNWETATVLALIISAIIVSLTYMVSIGFDMPDLKAWAGTELSQIIATAIIIASLVVVLVFINELVVNIVELSQIPGLKCEISENCLNKTASFYFDGYIDKAKNQMRAALEEVKEKIAASSRRINSYCSQVLLPIPCLQFSTSFSVDPDLGKNILDAERAAFVFEYYQNLLSSMEAQKFFVQNVSYTIGPILLALGIFGRSFFFTRRLGGLLIAIAIAIMVVLPLMYLFDWIAMQVTLYGSLPFSGSAQPDCPEECQQQIPVAYTYGFTHVIQFNNTQELADLIFKGLDGSNTCTPEQNMELATEIAMNLTSGKMETYTILKANMEIHSCEAEAQKNKVVGSDNDNYTCDAPCRILPYPYGNGECAKYITQYACSKLTDNCKIKRLVKVKNIDQYQYNSCPAECKIIPPLKNDCKGDTAKAGFPPSVTPNESQSGQVDMCLDSRFDCRVWYRDGTWAPQKKMDELEAKAKEAKKEEKEAYTATIEKCGFAKNCEKPSDPYNKDQTNDTKLSIQKALDLANNSCVYIYPTPNNENCGSCLTLEKAYLYNPPIRTEEECKQLCTPQPKKTMTTGDTVPLLVEGNVGPSILTNVSKLLVPVYLLPLFNILVTVMFIRSFSKFLGGDIEIPGLAKVI